MAREFSLSRTVAYAAKFPVARMGGFPTLANIEVTKRCNARCDFCDYWKTREEARLDDYVPVLEKLKPMVVVLTGGEPLLRSDLEHIIRRIREHSSTLYLGMVTNAAALSLERARALWGAGLDQLSISLDFLDERHDRARGVPGLTKKILDLVPRLVDAGISNVIFNTVIKADNLDQILPIVDWAATRGVKVSLSAYNCLKTGDGGHRVRADQQHLLRQIVDELLLFRRMGRTVVASSYYLGRIPEFFANGAIGDCVAGQRFIDVTPDGYLKRCAEFGIECHYSAWTPRTFARTACRTCWVSCRGEAQAPLTIERLKQVLTLATRETEATAA